MKAAFLFGGSGYIAHFLLKRLLELDKFNHYFVCDIKKLKGFDSEIAQGIISYHKVDVRNSIELKKIKDQISKENSWIFNFAAVHREPGHEQKEYFDTNIKGARHVNRFSEELGVNNVFFTSSIAPYGRSLEERKETSQLYPETPYGISKAMAELLHQNWNEKQEARRLVIVRPSVIYGPNDPGNVYRMIKGLKNGTFIIPNKGEIIKAYGYVYGLIDSILFVMSKTEKLIIYNYAENPLVNLKEMTKIAKKELHIDKITLSIPVKFLAIIAFFFQAGFRLLGKNTDIHPVRVRKAGFPTNIRPQYLIDNNFNFVYGFKNSLLHWKKVNPSDFE